MRATAVYTALIHRGADRYRLSGLDRGSDRRGGIIHIRLLTSAPTSIPTAPAGGTLRAAGPGLHASGKLMWKVFCITPPALRSARTRHC
jgi:hypothetical protein